MDGLNFIETLDSLWLFSNVLSSTTPILTSVGDCNGSAIQNHFKHPPKSETFKPITPILQSHQTQSPNSEIVPLKCPKCGDLGVEVEEEEEKEERRKRNTRKLKNWDFGFCMMQKSGRGFGKFGNEYDVKMMMAAFSDGMAMKEHLKSWAYAVACTVK